MKKKIGSRTNVWYAAVLIFAAGGLSASALADDVPTDDRLLEAALGVYVVFNQDNAKGHHAFARLALVKTRPTPEYGLFFLQTRGSARGEGMLCNQDAVTQEDAEGSIQCSQTIGSITETLKFGHIESQFCANLREKENHEHIVTPAECTTTYNYQKCACYEIIRVNPGGGPPGEGSGVGGAGGDI